LLEKDECVCCLKKYGSVKMKVLVETFLCRLGDMFGIAEDGNYRLVGQGSLEYDSCKTLVAKGFVTRGLLWFECVPQYSYIGS
jgi:hypothetical protein